MGKIFDALNKTNKKKTKLKKPSDFRSAKQKHRLDERGISSNSQNQILKQSVKYSNNQDSAYRIAKSEVEVKTINEPNEAEKIISIEDIQQQLLEIRKKNTIANPQKKLNRKPNKKKRKDKLFTSDKPNSIISEHFKIIRTLLLQIIKERKIRTILVTSALPEEGKSFITSNISVSIAKGFDEHVLLVDADLKRPRIHEFFNLKSEKGLSDFLLDDKLELKHLIQKTLIPKLSILSAGSLYENTSELISSEIMTLFVNEVKYHYDDRIVIFDSPPAQISESIALANKVDGIIMVIKANSTEKGVVEKTIELLGKDKIIGVILNHCKQLNKSYYQYYRYY